MSRKRNRPEPATPTIGELAELSASDLSFRIHREIRSFEARRDGKKSDKGHPIRITFAPNQQFWHGVLEVYRSKARATASSNRKGASRNNKELENEFLHIENKIDEFFNGVTKATESLERPNARPGSITALESTFRSLHKRCNANFRRRIRFRIFLSNLLACKTFDEAVRCWCVVASPNDLNKEKQWFANERRTKWNNDYVPELIGKSDKHIAYLRAGSRTLIEHIDSRENSNHRQRRVKRPSLIPNVRSIPWHLISTDGWSVDVVKQIEKKLERAAMRGAALDMDRVRRIIIRLNPSKCYIGVGKFDGYIVFCFDDSSVAVLESPLYGNASYVISGDWMTQLRSPKLELLDERSPHIERVIHRSADWIQKLQSAIRRVTASKKKS